jgi:hypothetical protein
MSSKKSKANRPAAADVAPDIAPEVQEQQAHVAPEVEAPHAHEAPEVHAHHAHEDVAETHGIADFQTRAMEFGLRNFEQGVAFGNKLMTAREFGDVLALQQDFAQAQADALKTQATELNDLALRMARETAESMQNAFTQSLKDWSRSFAA